jgi:hypothetical protein
MGETALTASVCGAKEVWGAVVAPTLTTLAVFPPIHLHGLSPTPATRWRESTRTPYGSGFGDVVTST